MNALPTSVDRARPAKALTRKPAGRARPVRGMPITINDLTDVEGVRTTQGSPIYQDTYPARSDLLAGAPRRQRRRIYAKSNTPEFGAGANIFN